MLIIAESNLPNQCQVKLIGDGPFYKVEYGLYKQEFILLRDALKHFNKCIDKAYSTYEIGLRYKD